MKYDADGIKDALGAWLFSPSIDPPEQGMEQAITAYLEATGSVIVPKKPTEEMCSAGYHADAPGGIADNAKELAWMTVAHVYSAMIKVAP